MGLDPRSVVTMQKGNHGACKGPLGLMPREQCRGLDLAESDLCWCQKAQPMTFQQCLAAQEKQQRKQMDLCVKGTVTGAEESKASEDTGEMAEASPDQEGRREGQEEAGWE